VAQDIFMTNESKKIFGIYFTAFTLTVLLLLGINTVGRGISPPAESPWKKFQPTARDVHEGRRIMERNGCFSCHAVSGFGGTIGPELSGVTVRRERENLYKWIRNPWELQPGTRMPTFSLSQDDILKIIGYLESLDTVRIEQ
jgi:cytochrome c2